MRIDASKKAKDVIIYYLRMYFENKQNFVHLLPENLTDDVFDNMQIYDTSPEVLQKLPLVVVAGGPGKMITSGLSDFASELYTNDGDLEGYLYGGQYEFTIQVEVATRTTLEREALIDIVASALRFSIRRQMEVHGILIKDLSYSGENKINYSSDYIYTSTLNLVTWSEWYDTYKLLPIDKITTKLQN